ncbi:hypothetical protein SAMN05216355_10962 [Actinomyces ruminicola]|uniref:Uncharacterized protein n=1 Tax=Actinomyces ruminicola TaxID=332524 RepID=A0A1H0D753_9ACTO|nr:hypothetical protein [Actinomyces ruminicola]SDN66017.1 hypothetical protein SAMN05216355_10962 [Actinomyces ruminicola]
MTALVLLLAGLASALPVLERRLVGEGSSARRAAAVAAGTGALVVVGILLARGPLGLSAAGVAVAIAVPVAWSAWDALAPAEWSGPVSLVAIVVAVGVCAVLAAPVGTSVARACAVVGAVILLGVPANGLVSAVLELARGSQSSAGALRPLVAAMRGGRWIGPLERILILLLAAAGAQAAVAAVIAAKGVIRFPEIN